LGSENWIAIQKLERDCDPNLYGLCPKFDPKFGSRSGYRIRLLLMRKKLAAFWFHGSRIVIQNLDHDLLLMRILTGFLQIAKKSAAFLGSWITDHDPKLGSQSEIWIAIQNLDRDLLLMRI
jgi:hypothetical protein